eukprot:CAMPEP_0197498918 /NCGR_PEP_ID=MMETSP1311-20131121/60744_1 /TAXON_ID=464262 /ORGANISM="Genus nov. species nov., Strain RCC856" /LENGTH=52 /DNA_ID=CAMNT_0043044655 /DNA_START=70 /DNA_END=225 /DNA_ORIENTATION=-
MPLLRVEPNAFAYPLAAAGAAHVEWHLEANDKDALRFQLRRALSERVRSPKG